jgi:hypothetical protein
MSTQANTGSSRVPWNKGRPTGQKPPLKLKEIWAIRVRLQLSSRVRDLAMFNLAIDSKLRACDLTKLRVRNVCHGEHIAQPRDDHAAEDATARTVRDYGADPRQRGGMDKACGIACNRLPVPEPNSRLSALVDAAIRSAG